MNALSNGPSYTTSAVGRWPKFCANSFGGTNPRACTQTSNRRNSFGSSSRCSPAKLDGPKNSQNATHGCPSCSNVGPLTDGYVASISLVTGLCYSGLGASSR